MSRILFAIALGGVPIGVPIPPIFAPIGMARRSAVRPFASGIAFNTGAKKAIIIAAVAVLLTNIEKKPVMRMKPRSTLVLFLPKGFKRMRASVTSRPVFVAAIANINPPRKRMIMGSAKVAITSLELKSVPSFSGSMPLVNVKKASLDMVKIHVAIIATDVHHEGITSSNHIKVANAKRAIVRCCTIVSSGIPNISMGMFQSVSVTARVKTKATKCLGSLSIRRFCLF